MLPTGKTTPEQDERMILSYLNVMWKKNPNENPSLLKIFAVLKKSAPEVLKTVQRLEEKGFVQRIADEKGTVKELKITEKGIEYLQSSK